MKNLFLILFFVSVVSVSAKAQQQFKAGLKLGISTSQVEGDTYAGFNKAGIDGGGFVTGKISKNWTAIFEISYIQKGSKHTSNAEKGDPSAYLLQLNYLEVPVLMQYHEKKFTFEAGPSFSYLINMYEYNESGLITGALPFKKDDISLNVGISHVLYKNFSINWRFSNSIFSIRDYASGAKRWYNPGERNNVLAFTLNYQFGNAEQTE